MADIIDFLDKETAGELIPFISSEGQLDVDRLSPEQSRKFLDATERFQKFQILEQKKQAIDKELAIPEEVRAENIRKQDLTKGIETVGEIAGSTLGGLGGGVLGAGAGALAGPLGSIAGAGIGSSALGTLGGNVGKAGGSALAEYLGLKESGEGFIENVKQNAGENTSLDFILNGLGGAIPKALQLRQLSKLPEEVKALKGIYGAEKETVDVLNKGVKSLEAGNINPVARAFPGASEDTITSLGSKLRGGDKTVAENVTEMLAQPEFRAAKTPGETLDVIETGIEKIGGQIRSVIGDLPIQVDQSTLGITGRGIEAIRGTVEELASRAPDVYGDAAVFLQRLSPDVPVGELASGVSVVTKAPALSAAEMVDGVRALNKVKAAMKGFTTTEGGNLAPEVAQLSGIVQSLDEALHAGIQSLDPKMAKSVTDGLDKLRTMYVAKDALIDSTGTILKTEAQARLGAQMAVDTGASTAATVADRAASVAGSPGRGAVRGLATLFRGGASKSDKLLNSIDVGAQNLDELKALGLTQIGEVPSQLMSLPQAQVAGSLGAADVTQMTPSYIESQPTGQPGLVSGIDTSSFYSDKYNIPDQGEDEQTTTSENSVKFDRGVSSILGGLTDGKDLASLGFEPETAKRASVLLTGSAEDKRQGLGLLLKSNPEKFNSTEIPGFESLVDGVVTDDAEKQLIQDRIKDVYQNDTTKKMQLLQAVRTGKPLPSYAYEKLGGKSKDSFEEVFLKKEEGFKTEGYVPEIGNSAVTVGMGVDLGQQSIQSLRDAGVPETVIAKVYRYVGLDGQEGKRVLKAHPLNLSEDEALILSKQVQKQIVDTLDTKYEQAAGAKLSDLPVQARTALISLAYNLGPNFDKNKPKIWNAAVAGDWEQVANRLERTRWKNPELNGRRKREAALLREIAPNSVQLASNALTPDDVTGEADTVEGKRLTYSY